MIIVSAGTLDNIDIAHVSRIRFFRLVRISIIQNNQGGSTNNKIYTQEIQRQASHYSFQFRFQFRKIKQGYGHSTNITGK